MTKPHHELLCFFAQSSGYQQCILGLDLAEYDRTDMTMPILVMSGEEAKPLLKVHGRRFKRAYRVSGPGNTLVVTYSDGQNSGWFKIDWKMDPERVMSQGIEIGAKEAHNPVIGYLLVDHTYTVVRPPGTLTSPAFYSRKEALEAAEAYELRGRVHEVVELHLQGVMSAVLEDESDIVVDGRTAQRFVRACEQRGWSVNQEMCQEIDERVRDMAYSCRRLLPG
ncbi:MAG: hypothetical protein GY847_11075 [Proteobacteria bacterium]|nr:hypothetical protein [Pseudomonadota bacterium]